MLWRDFIVVWWVFNHKRWVKMCKLCKITYENLQELQCNSLKSLKSLTHTQIASGFSSIEMQASKSNCHTLEFLSLYILYRNSCFVFSTSWIFILHNKIRSTSITTSATPNALYLVHLAISQIFKLISLIRET